MDTYFDSFSVYLKKVKCFCERMNESNAQTHKLAVLRKYSDDNSSTFAVRRILRYVYDTQITFGITSENTEKYNTYADGYIADIGLFELLDMLKERTLSGGSALHTVKHYHDGLESVEPGLGEYLYRVIDKDLKIRANAKLINKVFGKRFIPEFEVSLCDVYGKAPAPNFETERWYASRKLDGCRCLVFVRYSNGEYTAECYSRQGKRFETLKVIEDACISICREKELHNVVFDGEVCIVDDYGDEDFQSIIKEIRRKNHTIDNPRYFVFDLLTIEEFEQASTERTFSQRNGLLYDVLCSSQENYDGVVRPLTQNELLNDAGFQRELQLAQDNNWEGIVIRRDDCIICKRSPSMQKCKTFSDAEYTVVDAEMGRMRVVENGQDIEREVLSNIVIEHRGNRVGVGSGFTLEQRLHFFAHPEDILGKTVTIKYFEETKDQNGNYSLRFPVVKHIYENGRDV